MNNIKYTVSFTSGSLLQRESLELAALYMEVRDWNEVRDNAVKGNLLQIRTMNSLKRVCSEIISRLKTLSLDELGALKELSHQEQGYLLWIAVCRRYKFIADFAVEILRDRFLTLRNDVSPLDFDAFFNRKSEWHPELDRLKSETRGKLREVLFRMLREAGLLTQNNMIIAVVLSPRMLEIIHRNNRENAEYFPVFGTEQRG